MDEKEPKDHPLCKMKNCVNYDKGRCARKNPEKYDDACLHFEDVMDSLRLKANSLEGTLERE